MPQELGNVPPIGLMVLREVEHNWIPAARVLCRFEYTRGKEYFIEQGVPCWLMNGKVEQFRHSKYNNWKYR